jgi:hypothetical protein
MATKDELNNALDQFDHNYDKISRELMTQYSKNINQGMSSQAALDSAIIQIDYNQKLVNLAYSGYQLGLIANDYKIVDNESLKKWFEAYKSPYDKLTISKRIAKNNTKLKSELKDALKNADTWQKTALKLRKTGDVSGELPKYIKDVTRLYKKTNPTPTDLADLKRALKKAQKNINKLAANDAPNTALKKAYQNMIDIASGAKKGSYEKGILRAIRNKAKYNAERISRTEISRANAAAVKQRLLDDEDIIGVKYNLNTRHKIVDQCDFFAKSNSYGMGAGVQPRSMGIRTPWHSNCFCYVTFVYRGEVGPLNKDESVIWLDKNPGGTTQKERNILSQGKLPKRFNPHTYHDIDSPPSWSIELQK